LRVILVQKMCVVVCTAVKWATGEGIEAASCLIVKISVLSFHILLCLSSACFLKGFPNNFLYSSFVFPIQAVRDSCWLLVP